MSVSVPSSCAPRAHDDRPCGSQLPAGVGKWSFASRCVGRGHGTCRIRSPLNQKESVEEVLDAESFYWQQVSLGTVIERVTGHLG